jgi:hypothetical protein
MCLFKFNLRRYNEAVPVEEGRRVNLIMWCRSSRVREHGKCAMCGRDKTETAAGATAAGAPPGAAVSPAPTS